MKKKIISLSFLNVFLFTFLLSLDIHRVSASNLENGKKVFTTNCVTCHAGGNNRIIPEKNLKKEALEANGMNTVPAITYQVLNGKNGMPAFDGRLDEKEIEDVAAYVIQQSALNFQNK
jgi:cytochrome c6